MFTSTVSLQMGNAIYVPYQRIIGVPELWYSDSEGSELAFVIVV